MDWRVDGARCQDWGAAHGLTQYGLELTVEDYVARLFAALDQARRVLTPTGTCCLNLGDSYTSGGRRAYDNAPVFVSRASTPSVIKIGNRVTAPRWITHCSIPACPDP